MSAAPTDSAFQNLDNLASAVQSFITAGALVVGGIFAYFKFFKDRVYRPRVDMTIEPTIFASGVAQTLVCRLTAKNIGTSKVALVRAGTALTITPGATSVQTYGEPVWGDLLAYDVFPAHAWIESGETIFNDVSIALPQPRNEALKIELRLVLRRRIRKNLEASGRAILPPGLPSEEVKEDAVKEDFSKGRRL